MSLGTEQENGRKTTEEITPPPVVTETAEEPSLSDNLRSLARQARVTGGHLTEAVGDRTEKIVVGGAEALERLGGRIARASSDFASNSIKFLSQEHKVPTTFWQALSSATPAILSFETYGRAWSSFEQGHRTENVDLIDSARKECLKAFVEAGVDITQLGSARLSRFGSIVGKLGRIGITVPKLADKMNMGDKLIDGVLQAKEAREFVDSFMSSKVPSK